MRINLTFIQLFRPKCRDVGIHKDTKLLLNYLEVLLFCASSNITYPSTLVSPDNTSKRDSVAVIVYLDT